MIFAYFVTVFLQFFNKFNFYAQFVTKSDKKGTAKKPCLESDKV